MPESKDVLPGLYESATILVKRIIEVEEADESPSRERSIRLLEVALEIEKIGRDIPK